MTKQLQNKVTSSTKQTGYSVYKDDAKIRTIQNTLADLYPKLPDNKFDIIYADPPWDYNGKLQFDKSSKDVERVDLSKKIFISSASFKYPTLKLGELMKLPVQEISNDDCLLFMWTSNPHLVQALELGKTWGFAYRTVAFVWDKMTHNPGQYTLSNCELCLVFKRGRIPKPRGARNIQQLVRSPRKEHSEKPIEVLQAIEKMFPTQKRIELFARRKTKGWSVWGLTETGESFNELSAHVPPQLELDMPSVSIAAEARWQHNEAVEEFHLPREGSPSQGVLMELMADHVTAT